MVKHITIYIEQWQYKNYVTVEKFSAKGKVKTFIMLQKGFYLNIFL